MKKAVIIGTMYAMTKPEADRKLLEIVSLYAHRRAQWGRASERIIDLYSHRYGKHSDLEMEKLVPLMGSRNGLKEVEQVA